MKNKELAKKVKTLRIKKGYSQEKLSEETGLSLRTIQRIENGETDPRGDSLEKIAAVFRVSLDEITDWTVYEDKSLLIAFNLSALSFILFPVLGILIPLIIWISKKDKVQKLNDTAKELLNFQITWTIALFIGYMITVLISVSKIAGTFNSQLISSLLTSAIIFIIVMYIFNALYIVINAIRLHKDKAVKYHPKMRFLRT